MDKVTKIFQPEYGSTFPKVSDPITMQIILEHSWTFYIAYKITKMVKIFPESM